MKKLHGLSGKFAVVAALTTVTMFGTGYAAWNFSQRASKDSNAANVVTHTDPTGSLTVDHETFYLIMDQGDSTATDNGIKEGLYFSTSNETTTRTVGTKTETIPDEAKIKAAKITTLRFKYNGSQKATNEEIKMSVTITPDAAYNQYVSLANGSFETDTQTYTGSELTFTYTLPTISWVASGTNLDENGGTTKTLGKPLTATAYDAMKTALSTASIKFEFTASVTA